MTTITLSSKGQITLPVEFRAHLNLQTGDKLIAEEAGGVITLRPAPFKDFLEACEAIPNAYGGKPISAKAGREAWAEGAVKRDKRSRR